MGTLYKHAMFMSAVAATALHSPMANAQVAANESADTPLPSAEESGSDGLQDIIVTARKRAERLQDVPIAISAIEGGSLAARNATNVKEIANISPGVFYRGHDAARPNLYIRGIGTRSQTGEYDPQVGTFIDGVYIGRFGAQVVDVEAVDRIEVLKGPQGTLFGRNTIGGALNIITASPTREFHARVAASYGFNQDFGGEQFRISGVASGPLAENISGMLSVVHSEADGPVKVVNTGKLTNGGGRTAVRAAFDFEPTDNLRFVLRGDYYRTNGVSTAFSSNDVGGLRPNVLLARPGLNIQPPPSNPYLAFMGPSDGHQLLKGGGMGLTTTYSNEAISLTSVTAYRESSVFLDADLDGTAFYIFDFITTEEAGQFSQEFRLANTGDGALSMDGHLDWTVGAFYFRERSTQHNFIDYGPDNVLVALPPPNGSGGQNIFNDAAARIKTDSYALFAAVGYKLTDALKIDVGVRYTKDRKRDSISNFTTAPGIQYSNFSLDLDETWSSIDPSVTLSYKITPDILTYINYSTGFKSGAFQVAPVNLLVASQIVDPEKLTAYQGGIKADLFDRRLRLNLAGFYYRYRDLQVQRTVLLATGGSLTSVTNGSLSELYGLEAQGQLIASSNLRFDYGYSYLFAEYVDYVFRPGVDFSGNRLPRAPKQTANLGATLDIPASFGTFTARASGSYMGSYFFEPSNSDAGIREPSHFTADASLDFATDAYSIGIYVRNLTGERQRNSVFNVNPTRLLETWDYRRVIGVRASAKW